MFSFKTVDIKNKTIVSLELMIAVWYSPYENLIKMDSGTNEIYGIHVSAEDIFKNSFSLIFLKNKPEKQNFLSAHVVT